MVHRPTIHFDGHNRQCWSLLLFDHREMIRWFFIIVFLLATLVVAVIDIRGRFRQVIIVALDDPPAGLYLGMNAIDGVFNVVYSRSFAPKTNPRKFIWKTNGLLVKQIEPYTFGGKERRYQPKYKAVGYDRPVFTWRPGPAAVLETEIIVNTFPILLPFGSCLFLLLSPSLFRFGRRWHRKRNGRCTDCGYSVMGNVSGVCPECGNQIFGSAGWHFFGGMAKRSAPCEQTHSKASAK